MRKMYTMTALLLIFALVFAPAAAAAAEPAGVFAIQTRDFEVKLYKGDDAQAIVDNNGAALLELEGYTPIVCDHWSDGMSVLYTVQSGDVAYIESAEGNRTWYAYLSTHVCVNTGYQLLSEGEDLAALRDLSLLLTYTCNGDGKTVTVVLWQMLEEEPVWEEPKI